MNVRLDKFLSSQTDLTRTDIKNFYGNVKSA